MADPAPFHKLAKEAGNRLGTYVMSYASGAAAVLFLALTQDSAARFTGGQKVAILVAFVFYVATALVRMVELHIDARRFFSTAKQLELPEARQDWSASDAYRRTRVRLIYGSYVTLSIASLAAVVFMGLRLA